jgi:nitroreductase
MRYCVRVFEETGPTEETIREILDYARYAACSKNMQPWKVFVLQGESLKELAVDMVGALTEKKAHEPSRPDVSKPPSEYWARARKCGFSLFKLKGIERDDYQKRQEHYADNYRFFNAPVEIFFAMHQDMPERQLIDMGIFLERVMSKAQDLGLASCPQASVADFPEILQKHLPLEEGCQVLFGLALGYEKKTALVNEFRTEKLSIDEFTTWLS